MDLRVTPERRHTRRGTPEAPDRVQLEATILDTYREMPRLALRVEQAARLLGLQPEPCRVVLEDLVHRGALAKDARDQYVNRG